MLREVGKRSLAAEEEFLKKHYRDMPRTMLRYAIERFPETKRRRYMAK
jgi:3-methyladenine DNA glycosylase AlkD